MSQQEMTLRKSVRIARRHKVLVGIMVVLGLLIGAAYVLLAPPMLTGEALVVVPMPIPTGSNVTTGTGLPQATTTNTVVASSAPVLSAAQRQISPSMTLSELASQVKVTAPTETVIAIDGHSKNAAQAVAMANAVANSFIAYVTSASSPVGKLPARVLELATSASGTKLSSRLPLYALLGGLAGALVGFILALAVGRKDRRLRLRDEIANAIGIPVLASVPVARPSDAAAWTGLLENYEPKVVDAWHLRSALQYLRIAGFLLDNGGNDIGNESVSLAVVTLSSDRGALALGPQLATFAASLGIPTELVIGPQQDATATAMLRTACATLPHDSLVRGRPLRVTVSNDGSHVRVPGAALVVVVVVIDSQVPRMPDTIRTGMTLLGVSAGAATAEQMAAAATIVSTDGREITGVLVADPDPADQATGRAPRMARPPRRLPARLKDIPTEIRR